MCVQLTLKFYRFTLLPKAGNPEPQSTVSECFQTELYHLKSSRLDFDSKYWSLALYHLTMPCR